MSDDTEIKARRLLQQFDHSVAEINKRNIGEIAGEIREQDILKLAEAVSICRANYLSEVLQMANAERDALSTHLSEKVVKQRVLYHESLRGFNALRQALERGYCTLKSD